MKKFINFVAYKNTFKWDQIGGTDSYMRRLSLGLINAETKVNWLFYGKKDIEFSPVEELKIYHFSSFKNLFTKIEKLNEPIVICYLQPIDRLKLIFYSFNKNLNLYYLSFFFPDTTLKKILRYLEIKFTNYKSIFCVSKRISLFTKKIKSNVVFLPPIIPSQYFSIGKEKIAKRISSNEKINVSFIGRLDPRKGIYEVINLINQNKNKNINWLISGIYISNDIKKTKILKTLRKLPKVNFVEENRNIYNHETEKRLLMFFKECNIFLQPYKNLSSTVDLPLLILEAQASGCIVLTTLPNVLNQYIISPSKSFSSEVYIRNSQEFLNFFVQNPKKLKISLRDLLSLEDMYSEDNIIEKFTKSI